MSSSAPTDLVTELVLAERRGAALVLTLNRPDAGNAISADVSRAFGPRVDAARGDATLRAVIITGAGDRYFCTGGDVKAYARLESPAALDRAFILMRDVCDALEALPCPVIAAVNGYAVGGGAELMLACDLRIAETQAQIGFPQSRLGIMPGWDGTDRLLRTVGRANAARLLFSGKRVSAPDALALGLVDEVAPRGGALDQALALAATFAEVAPLSLGAIKFALRDAAGTDQAGARARAREAFARL
ncbi:MAG: enoyl-CoA hydratase/isomerase family protein, partial [Burkholderiales bacterium]